MDKKLHSIDIPEFSDASLRFLRTEQRLMSGIPLFEAKLLTNNLRKQIDSMRIMSFNQIKFSLSSPFFNGFHLN